MLTLAIVFAGLKSYGQVEYIKHVEGTPGCVTAQPLGCATAFDHLHPNPGQNYTYEISTDPTAVDAVHWFVTDQSTIIDGTGTAPALQTIRDAGDGTGSYILNAETGVYDVATNTQKTIQISWQYFDASSNDVLLVAYVTGASGCSDNVEVWKIEPAFSFTLDVLSMSNTGAVDNTNGTPASECVSPVESATYNSGSPGTLTMDYGENWVFFSVNAANFVDSWMPTISATTTSGTIGTIEWAYPDQAQLVGGTWYDPTAATPQAVEASALATDGVVGATGECIVVRVQVEHGSDENPIGTGTTTVELSIDGIMYDAANTNYTNTDLADVDDDGTNCVQNITDTATSILTARPEITEVSPTPALGPFVPKN